MIIRNTDNELKDALIAKAKRLGLTVSNNAETNSGIENIELGHCISVGTSDKFHINWAKRIDYYAEREIVPVYDIVLDWSKISSRLEQYANNTDTSVRDSDFEEEDDNTISLDNGNEVFIDKEEQEVVIEGDLTLSRHDLDTLQNLLATLDIDVVADSDSRQLNVGGYRISYDELDMLAEKLND